MKKWLQEYCSNLFWKHPNKVSNIHAFNRIIPFDAITNLWSERWFPSYQGFQFNNCDILEFPYGNLV